MPWFQQSHDQQPLTSDSRTLTASIGVAVSGVLWGVFWMPVRYMESQSLGGPWPSIVFFGATILMVIPIALMSWRSLIRNTLEIVIIGLLCGGAFALYIVSLLLTDVVKAILMFYLTPAWSTLGVWLLYRTRVTWSRIAVLVCGFGGLWVILGAGSRIPWPTGAGDWMALVSGICWAGGSMYLYRGARSSHTEQLLAFSLGGLVLTGAVLPLLPTDSIALPQPVDWQPLMVGVLLAVVMLPANWLVLWAAGRLEPARVSILLMMEVVVGVITAAIFAGEPFTWREGLGAGLIVAAGLFEVAQQTTPAPSSNHLAGSGER